MFSTHAICNTFAPKLTNLRPTVSRTSVKLVFKSMSSLAYPPPTVVEAKGEHRSTVFMLHGLGDTAAGWTDIAPMLGSTLPNTRFIFPTAPIRPITLNSGMAMTGWYDILSLEEINEDEDRNGISLSSEYVRGLVQQEIDNGIRSEKVGVGGFSQGGAVALMSLRWNIKIGAVIGLSAYLPLRTDSTIVSIHNKQTPVLMCHGDCDAVVSYDYGRMSASELRKAGASVDFKSYKGMAHSACGDELHDIGQFLSSCI